MAKRPRANSATWPLCWCALSLLPVVVPLAVPQAQEQLASERHVSEFRGLGMCDPFSEDRLPIDERKLRSSASLGRSAPPAIASKGPSTGIGLGALSIQRSPVSSRRSLPRGVRSVQCRRRGILTGGALTCDRPLVEAGGCRPVIEVLRRTRDAQSGRTPDRIALNPAAVTVRKTRPRCVMISRRSFRLPPIAGTDLEDRASGYHRRRRRGADRGRTRRARRGKGATSALCPTGRRSAPRADFGPGDTTAGDYRKYREAMANGWRTSRSADPGAMRTVASVKSSPSRSEPTRSTPRDVLHGRGSLARRCELEPWSNATARLLRGATPVARRSPEA